MSTKNGKRSRRKTEDDETQECFKTPLLKKDDDAAAATMESGECKGFDKDTVKALGHEKRNSVKPDNDAKSDVKTRNSEAAQKKHDDEKVKGDDGSLDQKKLEEGAVKSKGLPSTRKTDEAKSASSLKKSDEMKGSPSLKKSEETKNLKQSDETKNLKKSDETKSLKKSDEVKSLKKGGDEPKSLPDLKKRDEPKSLNMRKGEEETIKTKSSLSLKKGEEEVVKSKSEATENSKSLLSEEIAKAKCSVNFKKSDEETVKTRSSPSLKKGDEEGMKTRSSPSLKKVDDEGVKTRSSPSLKKGEEEGVKTRHAKAAEPAESAPMQRNLVEHTDGNCSDNTIVDESTAIDFEAGTNGFNSAVENQEDDVEMEPLVVDSEEADPELQFDENSDGESPVISRCTTRRSQTRNIPTPKTPKSFSTDQNGDRSTPETGSEGTEEFDKLYSVEHNESSDSFASTKVNVGGDDTRRQDLSFSEKDSFLNTAKELTVVETMRRLSSRRSIHPSSSGDYRKNLLKSNTERQNVSLPYVSTRSSVEKVGTKRKNRSETPDGIKRFKPEPSQPGLLSYITSPLQKIKNKFSPKEVSASTPKLTGYRKADLLEEAEISKIEIELTPQGEKKWCSIM